MQLTINLSGQAEVLKSLRDKLFDTNSRLTEVIQKGAFDIERDAKVLARVDLGRLRASITVEMVSDEEARIGTNVEYAPYVEFGTGGKVSIPIGYESYASQFKGKSDGTFTDMVKALAEWVKKKGIVASYSIKTQRRVGNKANNEKKDNATAWAIAISIIKKGLRPQPFLIPAFEQEKPKLKSRILNIIKNAKS